jgi:hypothetical protein
MPLDLQTLREHIETVIVPFGEETITVDYRPANWTNEAFTKRWFHETLAPILVRWDITDGNVPVMPETEDMAAWEKLLRERIPTPVLQAVYEAIIEDMQPGNERASRSLAPLQPTASMVASRNGTAR